MTTDATKRAEVKAEPESWERSNWCLACGHWIGVHKDKHCEFSVHACDCTMFVDPVLALRAFYAHRGLPFEEYR